MRQKSRISEIAEQRAAEYAPRPKHGAANLVMIGALVAGTFVLVFTTLIGKSPDDYQSATAITIIIGAVIPGTWHWLKERAHFRAWNNEYEELRSQAMDASKDQASPKE